MYAIMISIHDQYYVINIIKSMESLYYIPIIPYHNIDNIIIYIRILIYS